MVGTTAGVEYLVVQPLSGTSDQRMDYELGEGGGGRERGRDRGRRGGGGREGGRECAKEE